MLVAQATINGSRGKDCGGSSTTSSAFSTPEAGKGGFTIVGDIDDPPAPWKATSLRLPSELPPRSMTRLFASAVQRLRSTGWLFWQKISNPLTTALCPCSLRLSSPLTSAANPENPSVQLNSRARSRITLSSPIESIIVIWMSSHTLGLFVPWARHPENRNQEDGPLWQQNSAGEQMSTYVGFCCEHGSVDVFMDLLRKIPPWSMEL